MGLFGSGIWKNITVSLTDRTFTMKVIDKKEQITVAGKITLKVPYSKDFTFDTPPTLIYKPTKTVWTFESVAKEFEKMLKEGE